MVRLLGRKRKKEKEIFLKLYFWHFQQAIRTVYEEITSNYYIYIMIYEDNEIIIKTLFLARIATVQIFERELRNK